MNINEKRFIGHEQAKGDNMLNTDEIREVLRAISDAGLCVCDTRLVPDNHPGLINSADYIIGRLEESGYGT